MVANRLICLVQFSKYKNCVTWWSKMLEPKICSTSTGAMISGMSKTHLKKIIYKICTQFFFPSFFSSFSMWKSKKQTFTHWCLLLLRVHPCWNNSRSYPFLLFISTNNSNFLDKPNKSDGHISSTCNLVSVSNQIKTR